MKKSWRGSEQDRADLFDAVSLAMMVTPICLFYDEAQCLLTELTQQPQGNGRVTEKQS